MSFFIIIHRNSVHTLHTISFDFYRTQVRTEVLMTHLEEFISNLYSYLRIRTPQQQSIHQIANRLNLNVHYGCTSFRIGNDIIIRRSTKEREWQMFGHELGHYFRHCGNQYLMHHLFQNLQENQASNFTYHFCVPTFMLDNLKDFNVYDIMSLFTVEYQFALTRLKMYERKVINERSYC